MKPIETGPFLGINNRRQPSDLHVDKVGDFLSDAVNVDIDASSRLRRRAAAEFVQSMTGAHSLHNGYLVRGAALYAVTLPTYSETLLKVLSSDAPMSYVDFAGSTYYSNGVDSGRIAGTTVYPIALPAPGDPVVSAIAGSLHAGSYQVALSYANSVTGEEGAVSAFKAHALTAEGGLRIMLPGEMAGATHINVYVSTLNGAIPFLQASVLADTISIDVSSLVTGGREASLATLAPLPPGRLFMHNGALCSHAGGDLYRGVPYRAGYHLPAESRIPFPATISNAVSAQNGVYVVADKTYWLAGTDLADVQTLQDVLPYGGVPGTTFETDDKALVGWFGAQGIVLATPAGEVEAIMADNIDLTAPLSGLSFVRSTRGYRRVVSCGWCLNLDKKAATRYQDYEFTSVSGEYGTMPDGIYRLEGAGPVDASAAFGDLDFSTSAEKRLLAAYLGAASERPLSLVVGVAGESYAYDARSCSDGLDIHRVDPGKGLKANWFVLSIANIEGADFTLASVSFVPAATNRRI